MFLSVYWQAGYNTRPRRAKDRWESLARGGQGTETRFSCFLPFTKSTKLGKRVCRVKIHMTCTVAKMSFCDYVPIGLTPGLIYFVFDTRV